MSTPRNISLTPPSRDIVLKPDSGPTAYSVTLAEGATLAVVGFLTQKMAEEAK